MQVTIKAHFNKQTKDSKKELVQFYVTGDDEQKRELNMLCREVCELTIANINSLTAEFVKKTQDSKKTMLEFIVKGGTSTAHSYEFYRLAGTDVELTISESQMSIEEFKKIEETKEIEGDKKQAGLKVEVDPDGTVELKQEDKPADDGKVTSITAKAQAKLDKAKAADPMAALINETKEIQDDPDKLPF